MTKFDAWLKSANAGEIFVYNRGAILRENAQVYAVRIAYDAGLIDLYQRRIEQPRNRHSLGDDGVGSFEYIAAKRAVADKRQPSFWRTEPERRAA